MRQFFRNDQSVNIWNGIYDPEAKCFTSNILIKRASALYYASFGGFVEVVRDLLRRGADVNCQGGFHGYPLQVAAARGHKEVAQLLVEEGADINVEGGIHLNALMEASFMGHRDIVKLLISAGANVNAQRKSGTFFKDVRGNIYGTALEAASVNGHLGIVRELLAAGADPKASAGNHDNIHEYVNGNIYGTALQAIFDHGHLEIAKLLIDAGADVNACSGYNNDDATPDFSDIQSWISKYAQNGQRFRNRIFSDIPGLEKFSSPNGFSYGRVLGHVYGNALQTAATKEDWQTVQELIANGADPNPCNQNNTDTYGIVHQNVYTNSLKAQWVRDNLEAQTQLSNLGINVTENINDLGRAYGMIYGNVYGALLTPAKDEEEPKDQKGEIGNESPNKQSDSLVDRFFEGIPLSGPVFIGDIYGTALQAASGQGHIEIVNDLLDAGADVNASGGNFGNYYKKVEGNIYGQSSRNIYNVVHGSVYGSTSRAGYGDIWGNFYGPIEGRCIGKVHGQVLRRDSVTPTDPNETSNLPVQ